MGLQASGGRVRKCSWVLVEFIPFSSFELRLFLFFRIEGLFYRGCHRGEGTGNLRWASVCYLEMQSYSPRTLVGNWLESRYQEEAGINVQGVTRTKGVQEKKVRPSDSSIPVVRIARDVPRPV